MRRGRFPQRAPAALLAFVAAAAAALAASERRGHSDAPVPEWREGPVRYVITKPEDEEYRQLDAEEDRRRFIETFWRRRDPTPETPGNEFRSTFWKRVREANSLYGKETTRPGWLTDMGKIHILFGPPDEISRDEMAQGRRGIIVWTYRSSPSIGGYSTHAGPNTVIPFAQDATGEYRMTAEPTKLANVWEGLPDPQPPMGTMKQVEARRRAMQSIIARYVGLSDPVIRAAGGPARETPLGMTMLLSRLQQPPKEWLLKGEVTTREFFGSLPFRARADFFKTSGAGVQVVLTVALRSRSVTYRPTAAGEQPSVLVYARLLDSTGSEVVLSLEHDGDFAPAPENSVAGIDDDLVYQARAILPPGSYVARLTILDEVSGRTGTSDTPFTVPDFGASGLEISSVSLARVLEPLEAGRGGPVAPFVHGTLRVVPRLGQEFRQDEDLAFYYQVYGARRDPGSGQPRLDVAYVFMAGDANGVEELGRVAFEGQTAEAHGYAIPLKDWPPGEYLVRIEVTDAVAATTTTRDVLFRVVPGEAGGG